MPWPAPRTFKARLARVPKMGLFLPLGMYRILVYYVVLYCILIWFRASISVGSHRDDVNALKTWRKLVWILSIIDILSLPASRSINDDEIMIYQEEIGLIIALWMTTVFPGLLAVMLRGLVRFRYDRRRTSYIIAADILIVLAFVASVWYCCGMSFLVIWGLIKNGGGRDEQIIPVDNGTTEKALQMGWITGNIYYFGLYAAKGAIIALLHGIIPESRYVHRKALFWVTCFVSICGAFTIAFNLFACWPIQNNWLLGPDNCYAYRLPKVLMSSSALQIITDLVLIALPLPLLRDLHISFWQKLGLASIFCLGSFCVFATVMRLILVYGPQDPNNNPSSIIWSGIEMSTGICVACAPAVRTFVRRRKNTNNSGGNSEGRWRPRRWGRSRGNRTATGVAELDRPSYNLLGLHPGGAPESGKSSAHGQPEGSQESSQSTTHKTRDGEIGEYGFKLRDLEKAIR